MTNETKINPCKCGSKTGRFGDVVIMREVYAIPDPRDRFYHVKCLKCNQRSEVYTNEEQAIKDWNSRNEQ